MLPQVGPCIWQHTRRKVTLLWTCPLLRGAMRVQMPTAYRQVSLAHTESERTTKLKIVRPQLIRLRLFHPTKASYHNQSS